jgi:CheY-like chemotaxis protein/anti-sigma regulatory factor (Ser/Thr protein kinase)
VYKLIKDIEIIFSQKIEEKGISLKIEVSSEIPQSLLLDETRLRQVLFNLVGNAVKFTDKGYVKLTVDQRISLEDAGKISLLISIEDTGIGIPNDQQELILTPFYQQEGQSTKKYGGTGLGLAITRRLVEMMGGDIIISSEVGKGSIFKVSLSNVEISDEEVLLKDELTFDPKTVVFKDAKVLIVDDNPENRNLIKDLLGYSSISLLEASNGKEAIEVARMNRPDLILMDLVMPEMNGLEATLELKKNKSTKSIPVIAISASAMSLTLEASQKKIFAGILLKPVNLTELVDSLKNFLKYDIFISQEESTETEQPIIDLTVDQIAQLPEIIHLLETEYLSEFKEVMQNQLINQMESFGKNMLALGKKYAFQILIKFGKEICLYTDNFDISKLPGTLKKFPGIIETLKTINRSKTPE